MIANPSAKKALRKLEASVKSRSATGKSLVARIEDGHVVIESRVGDGAPKVVERANLVGKFPEVKHFSAPRAELKIDASTRKQMLALMTLF